jgi:hypothetical protein
MLGNAASGLFTKPSGLITLRFQQNKPCPRAGLPYQIPFSSKGIGPGYPYLELTSAFGQWPLWISPHRISDIDANGPGPTRSGGQPRRRDPRNRHLNRSFALEFVAFQTFWRNFIKWRHSLPSSFSRFLKGFLFCFLFKIKEEND